MKVFSQIPLLLFVLITYAVIATTMPSWLGIKASTTANDQIAVHHEMSTEGAPENIANESGDLDRISADDPFLGTTDKPVFLMKLASGATWGMTCGEILISAALLLLFFEVFKSTRSSQAAIIDHLLSTVVFMIHLVLFIVWPKAGTGIFFILTMICLVDIMCGFTVSIASARRDVSLGTH